MCDVLLRDHHDICIQDQPKVLLSSVDKLCRSEKDIHRPQKKIEADRWQVSVIYKIRRNKENTSMFWRASTCLFYMSGLNYGMALQYLTVKKCMSVKRNGCFIKLKQYHQGQCSIHCSIQNKDSHLVPRYLNWDLGLSRVVVLLLPNKWPILIPSAYIGEN